MLLARPRRRVRLPPLPDQERRGLQPGHGRPIRRMLGISAPDPRTVRIELERPTPYLPILVALPPWYPVNPRVLGRFGAMARRGTAWTRPGNLVGQRALHARGLGPERPHRRRPEPELLERRRRHAAPDRLLPDREPRHRGAGFPRGPAARDLQRCPSPRSPPTAARRPELPAGRPVPADLLPALQRQAAAVRRPARAPGALARDRPRRASRGASSPAPIPPRTPSRRPTAAATPRGRGWISTRSSARRLLAEAGHAGGRGIAGIRGPGAQRRGPAARDGGRSRRCGRRSSGSMPRSPPWSRRRGSRTSRRSITPSPPPAGRATSSTRSPSSTSSSPAAATTGPAGGTGTTTRLIAQAARERDPAARLEVFQKAEELPPGPGARSRRSTSGPIPT